MDFIKKIMKFLCKEELKRFQWYSERYNNHQKSKNQEKVLLLNSDTIVNDLIDYQKMSWMQAQFYVNALKQVLENRHLLKYSYVLGYFRPFQLPFINKNIFENLQQDLERHTEMLSNLCDNKAYFLHGNMQNVINQTKVAEKLKESLLNAASDWTHPLEERSKPKKRTEKSEASSTKKSKNKKHDEQTEIAHQNIFSTMNEPELTIEEYKNDESDEEIRRRQERMKKKLNSQKPTAEQIANDAKELRKRQLEEAEIIAEKARADKEKKEKKEKREKDAREREEEDLKKAIEQSLQRDDPINQEDDWELEMAIQASLGK